MQKQEKELEEDLKQQIAKGLETHTLKERDITCCKNLTDVFQKSHELRTPAEYRQILPFLKQQKFFADLLQKSDEDSKLSSEKPQIKSDSDLLEIVSGMKLRMDPVKAQAAKFDESSDTLFILLNGTAQKWSPVPHKQMMETIEHFVKNLETNKADGFLYFDHNTNGMVDLAHFVKNYHALMGLEPPPGDRPEEKLENLKESRLKQVKKHYLEHMMTKAKEILEKGRRRIKARAEYERQQEAQQFGNRMQQAFLKMVERAQMNPVDYALKNSANGNKDKEIKYTEEHYTQTNENVWGIKPKNAGTNADGSDKPKQAVKKKATAGGQVIELARHQVTIDGKLYDFPQNSHHYFQISQEIQLLDSFGGDCLNKKESKWKFIIHCTSKCMFLILDRITYNRALQRVLARAVNAKVDFLMNVPGFNQQQKKQMQKFISFLEERQFIRNQYVYKEGDQADTVYIVIEGSFELTKKLPQTHLNKGNPQQMQMEHILLGPQFVKNQRNQNILASKLTEIKDLPMKVQRLSIGGPGSLVGEEDNLFRQQYSCSLQCLSQKGRMYRITREDFLYIKQSEQAWIAVLEKICFKELRMGADYIKHTPLDVEKLDKKESIISMNSVEEQSPLLKPQNRRNSIGCREDRGSVNTGSVMKQYQQQNYEQKTASQSKITRGSQDSPRLVNANQTPNLKNKLKTSNETVQPQIASNPQTDLKQKQAGNEFIKMVDLEPQMLSPKQQDLAPAEQATTQDQTFFDSSNVHNTPIVFSRNMANQRLNTSTRVKRIGNSQLTSTLSSVGPQFNTIVGQGQGQQNYQMNMTMNANVMRTLDNHSFFVSNNHNGNGRRNYSQIKTSGNASPLSNGFNFSGGSYAKRERPKNQTQARHWQEFTIETNKEPQHYSIASTINKRIANTSTFRNAKKRRDINFNGTGNQQRHQSPLFSTTQSTLQPQDQFTSLLSNVHQQNQLNQSVVVPHLKLFKGTVGSGPATKTNNSNNGGGCINAVPDVVSNFTSGNNGGNSTSAASGTKVPRMRLHGSGNTDMNKVKKLMSIINQIRETDVDID